MPREPKPQPMKKTYHQTSPSGRVGAPDQKYGGKPLKQN